MLLMTTHSFAKSTCGLNGDIDHRVEDCKESNHHFDLVTRFENGDEIYLDTKTNLIWSDRYANKIMNYRVAEDYCHDLNILDLSWRLPEVDDLRKHDKLSLSFLPHSQSYYWTQIGRYTHAVWVFKPSTGHRHDRFWDGSSDFAATRCVSKI